MATTYTLKLQPVINTVTAEKVVQSDGKTIPTLIGKNLNATQAAALITMSDSFPVDYWLELTQYIAILTVQPSTVQKDALIVYFNAIVAGTNTATVETAINAL